MDNRVKEDCKTRRVVQIGVDGGNKDIARGIHVNININSMLPFMSIPQMAGTGPVAANSDDAHTIEYNVNVASATVDTPNVADIKNVLVDPDMADRFTIITVVGTVGTNIDGVVYYDKKHNDMFVIPNLIYLGDGAEVDILKGRLVDIEGYVVGGYGGASYDVTDAFIFNIDNSTKSWLPEVAKQVPSKTHLMRIGGLTNESTFENFGINLGTYYLESTRSGTVNVVGLGNNQAVFGKKVPVYRMVRVSGRGHMLMYAGAQDVSDITFVLPW